MAVNNVRNWPAYSGSNGEVHQQTYQEMAGVASGAFFSHPIQQERKTEKCHSGPSLKSSELARSECS